MLSADLGKTHVAIAEHMIKEHGVSAWQATQVLLTSARVHEKLHTDPVLAPTWAHGHGKAGS